MSTNSSKIKRVLEDISNKNGKRDNNNLFFTAEVKKVDDETCDVEIAGTEYTGIHLAAVSDGNKNNLIIKPKVGSVVLICDKTGGDMAWMNVIAFSEIESITMKIDEIVINEGKNEGLACVKEIADKLEKIETRINDLIDDFGKAVPAPMDGGAALSSSLMLLWNTRKFMKTTKYTDLENKKIKH